MFGLPCTFTYIFEEMLRRLRSSERENVSRLAPSPGSAPYSAVAHIHVMVAGGRGEGADPVLKTAPRTLPVWVRGANSHVLADARYGHARRLIDGLPRAEVLRKCMQYWRPSERAHIANYSVYVLPQAGAPTIGL